MTGLSYTDLLNRAHGNVPARIQLRLLVAPDDAERLACIEEAIDWAIVQLAGYRNFKQGQSEDQRTVDLICMLEAIGFVATHDGHNGGHVDIAVRLHGLIWLAEAKNWRGCSWAFKGMRQLLTRYSSGLPGHNDGGLIFYFEQPDVASLMAKWKEQIEGKKISESVEQLSVIAFRSSHRHDGTGLTYRIRHFPVPYHWDPQDR